jgi:hypothetical protein
MPALPHLIAWTLGAIGVLVLMKLISREWQRINAEFERATVPAKDRKSLPTLRRDPVTGEYHVSQLTGGVPCASERGFSSFP